MYMCFVKQRSAEEEETGAFSRIGWRGMIIIEILHFCVYTLCIQIMCVYDSGKASACHSHDNNASELMTCVRRRPGALAHLCGQDWTCLLYTSPSPRDSLRSRMPSSA